MSKHMYGFALGRDDGNGKFRMREQVEVNVNGVSRTSGDTFTSLSSLWPGIAQTVWNFPLFVLRIDRAVLAEREKEVQMDNMFYSAAVSL